MIQRGHKGMCQNSKENPKGSDFFVTDAAEA